MRVTELCDFKACPSLKHALSWAKEEDSKGMEHYGHYAHFSFLASRLRSFGDVTHQKDRLKGLPERSTSITSCLFFLFAAHWTNARGLNPSLQVSSLYIWGDALVLHFPGATRPAKHRASSSTVNALFFKTICKAVAKLFSVSASDFLNLFDDCWPLAGNERDLAHRMCPQPFCRSSHHSALET